MGSFNLVRINQPVIYEDEEHGKIKIPIHLIVNENENPTECLRDFKEQFKSKQSHYNNFSQDFVENIAPDDFRFVYISTSQRCGTWWHKYFFKFYSDAVAKYSLHLGIKLRNPLSCKQLKTVFFVGHMPFPLEHLKFKNEKIPNFFINNQARVHKINHDYFTNHATSLKLIEVIRDTIENFKPYKYYFTYRNVFDQFASRFLLANRFKENPQNFSLFDYTKKFLLEPFTYQFLTYQWVEEKSEAGLVKINRFDDIIKDQKKYFRQLLADFNVPIYEEALDIATFLASKKFLDFYEKSTGLSINESLLDKGRIKHISTNEEKQGIGFTIAEKEFIKNKFINYGLNIKFFPEFNEI